VGEKRIPEVKREDHIDMFFGEAGGSDMSSIQYVVCTSTSCYVPSPDTASPYVILELALLRILPHMNP
jgi:hypothetical protein